MGCFASSGSLVISEWWGRVPMSLTKACSDSSVIWRVLQSVWFYPHSTGTCEVESRCCGQMDSEFQVGSETTCRSGLEGGRPSPMCCSECRWFCRRVGMVWVVCASHLRLRQWIEQSLRSQKRKKQTSSFQGFPHFELEIRNWGRILCIAWFFLVIHLMANVTWHDLYLFILLSVHVFRFYCKWQCVWLGGASLGPTPRTVLTFWIQQFWLQSLPSSSGFRSRDCEPVATTLTVEVPIDLHLHTNRLYHVHPTDAEVHRAGRAAEGDGPGDHSEPPVRAEGIWWGLPH